MNNDMMANSLVQTWVPVTDSQGRTRLEARWNDLEARWNDAVPAPTHVTHAA